MLIAEAVDVVSGATGGGDSTNLVTIVVSGVVSIAIVIITQVFTGRNKRKVDATDITEAGMAILPEMGDRVMAALRRVEELTVAVGRAQQEVAEARADAAAAKAEAGAALRELASAHGLITQLRAERDEAFVERDDFKRRLRLCQESKFA